MIHERLERAAEVCSYLMKRCLKLEKIQEGNIFMINKENQRKRKKRGTYEEKSVYMETKQKNSSHECLRPLAKKVF